MGTQGVREKVAEPEAGVGLDGDLLDRRFLLRRVLPGLLAGVDGGGAAVPDGLPEERSAEPGRSVDAVEVHAAGGGDGEGQSGVLAGRPGRADDGCGWQAGVPADGRGSEGRTG